MVPPRSLSILVVDDEESMRHFLGRGLRRLGHDVALAADGEQAVAAFAQRRADVTIVDVRMPGVDGLAVLGRIRAIDPAAVVVMMTAHGTIATAVDAMKLGAADFVQKPFEFDELWLRVERALELRQALRENQNLRALLAGGTGIPGLVCNSPAMRNLQVELELLRDSSATVLLTGESGSGKGLLARALHARSPRAQGPFVTINCPAVPQALFESELFGHEPGAFTGATQARQGHVLRAHGGTLLLDEIAELALPAQAKIERFLQEREFVPLGGSRPQRVDVRIVAATNRDLPALVAQGSFRAELLWRLKVVQLAVPPLRQRREDIPQLVVDLLQRQAARSGSPAKSVTAEAMAALCAYEWPGNVRELENLTERMAVLAGGRELLGIGDLPAEVRGGAFAADVGDYEAARRRFDHSYFSALLVRCDGSVTAAARQAGMSRGHLHRRLRELGCDAGLARGLDLGSEGGDGSGEPEAPRPSLDVPPA
jgi:DNA-binding NtrC family response regulator